MATVEQFRAFALGLPDVAESPHFEASSFRVPVVKGRIFATLPPGGLHGHVFLDEDVARAMALQWPTACSELWWGKKLSGVEVRLEAASVEIIEELLQDAWRRRAPKRLVAAFDDGSEFN